MRTIGRMMDGRKDRTTDMTDGWTDWRTDVLTHGRTDTMDGMDRTDMEQTAQRGWMVGTDRGHGHVHGRMDGRTAGRMEAWTDGRTDGGQQ